MAESYTDHPEPPPPSYDDIISGSPQVARVPVNISQSTGVNDSEPMNTVTPSAPGLWSAVSGSPHASDDEETSLLKAELRRLRDENMQQKKNELRRAIEMERSYTGTVGRQFGSGTRVNNAGANPAVYQSASSQQIAAGVPQPIASYSSPAGTAYQAVQPPVGTPQPIISYSTPAGSTSQAVQPPAMTSSTIRSSGQQQFIHPMVAYGTPQVSRPSATPEPAVASSSTAYNGPESPEDEDKKVKNGSTAACVVTFFVIISVTVVIVAVYGAL